MALVIFGASGDLTARKILPALAQLADRGVLDDGFTVIGVARTQWSDDEFRAHVAESTPDGGPKWKALTERFKYVAGEYDHPDTFSRLKDHLDEADRIDGTAGNRIYYLATIPSVFGHGGRRPEGPRLHPAAGGRLVRPGGGGEALRARPRQRAWPWTSRCTPPSTRARSTGSTTTWARRRCRTCWPSGSPTPSSSRSGTDATSSRSRSPWPRAWASSTGAASTRRPAPCGTSSRTTSCRCSPSP